MHIAFSASSHEQVDHFYRAALAAGGTCNGKPGYRPQYHRYYYACFVLDPDGNNLEAVTHYPHRFFPWVAAAAGLVMAGCVAFFR